MPHTYNVPWFICWFWHYINCLFVYLTFFLFSFFFTFFLILSSLLIYFLTHLLPDLSTPSRIGLFHFQAGGCRRRPNLAVVFCINSVLYYILLQMHVCFCCVRFCFSLLSQEIGWEECLRNNLIFYRVGHKTLTQSVN